MSTAVAMNRTTETLPQTKARIAGLLYLLAVLTAGSGETLLHGRLAVGAGLIAVLCFVGVTLLLYDIFKPVSQRVALLAACLSVMGLALEALRLNPRGVDLAMVFHGLYCLLFGYLIFRSTCVPRILGGLMAFAGLAWLTNLSPSVADYLSPYNVVAGFLGEGSLMLWLLAMGVNVQQGKAQVGAAGGSR